MSSQILDSYTSVKFQWKLNTFSKLGPKHESAVFSVRNLKWKVEVYPKGTSKTYDQLALFLVPADKNKLPYAEYSFVVTSQTNSANNFKGPEGKHKFTRDSATGRGWSSFMPLAQLHDRSKGYLQHDTCIIEVMVTCRTSEARA
ncbi:hypothetical protein C5167_030005 [Papaver somniferum]|uniref:ubiquitin carboxyl-terminal hydrolase 13-like n=1 Tax=Papaver somniferum TaxID=3469 RepID=UPI000E6FA515|nr:ubiquitin carboxyl-terminal hydrolase 13-like [Papaver somniferum]XP_026432242.1 ubiquitin carboxyl-terminal hydrolase 13-like [Papaver somniferum]RZC86655.1 hypothetical protein C5167_030006 [Papaver somniferum]RZC86656.1 hypothetical protein C5167_030005 [Papaver somniferum]